MLRYKIIGRPHTQNILCNTRCFIVQKLSIKWSAKVICRFGRLRTSHSKKQTSHLGLENLSAAYAFDYVVLRGNPSLTNCEDLVTALHV